MAKTSSSASRFHDLLTGHEQSILSEWAGHQKAALVSKRGVIRDEQVREDSAHFLSQVRAALQRGSADVQSQAWEGVRTTLGDLSRSRAEKGFTPAETATFVLSLKRPLFDHLAREFENDPKTLAQELWTVTELLDALGLYTTESFQKSREEIIRRQQQEMLELSTPVTSLWEGILAVPLIGTLDSARTQVVMESLLTNIVNTGATIAIVDITGVPTVDTLVAQHLLKTVSAARLMGADCIISGIRPQIAQTIVHLGVDLGDVITKATLAGAFQEALIRRGLMVTARV
jgi:rsbT co-antagonist protein RsbR